MNTVSEFLLDSNTFPELNEYILKMRFYMETLKVYNTVDKLIDK